MKALITIAILALTATHLRAVPPGAAWTPIGPFGTYNSESPANGRVRSIEIIGTDLYIGASGGGLWHSTTVSGGATWESLGENLPNPSVGAISVNPENSNDILIGSGDVSGAASRHQGAGMYKTGNRGQGWTAVALPFAPTTVSSIHRLAGAPLLIVAATDAGLMRSEDGPTGPWTRQLEGNITDLVVHPVDPSIQYCCKATPEGDDRGVYKSITGGKTWNRLTNTGAPANTFGNARIAICRDNPANVAFVYEWGGVTMGVFKSSTSGLSWTNITGTVSLGQTSHCLAITFRPNNANEIFVGANNIFRTQGGGTTWTNLDDIKPHQDQNQLYFNASTGDNYMWECNDGGIYRVDVNANNWVSWMGNAGSGLSISTIASMDARGTVRAIGNQDDGAGLSGDSGNTWTGYACCDVYNVAAADINGPVFWYNLPDDTRTQRQPLGGAEADVSDTNITPPQAATFWFESFTNRIFSPQVDTNGMVSLLSRSASETGTGVWTREVMNIPAGAYAIAGTRLNGKRTYLWPSEGDVVRVLINNGSTWSVTRNQTIGGMIGPGNDSYHIETIAASPDRAGEAWACMNTVHSWVNPRLGGKALILHTTDDWVNSQQLGELPFPLEGGQAIALAVTPGSPQELYVATNRGVLASNDGGVTWQPFQTGLPQSVHCIGITYVEHGNSAGQDVLALATVGRGMYQTTPLRAGIVYVDQRSPSSGQNGSREHPFVTVALGVTAAPVGGIVAVNGSTIYTGTGIITRPVNQPVTLTSYEAPAELR